MSSITTLPSVWKAWTNPRICLYHGTIDEYANQIKSAGVRVARGKPDTDFGQGFYTTTWLETANEWSEQKAAAKDGALAAVVKLSLTREALSKLHSMAFVRATIDATDYWSFVSSCRNQQAHMPASQDWYDVVYGPVAQNWRRPEISRVWPNYDQISFHTPTAESILNDPNLCLVEVI
jgi:hypothetical protein